MAGPRQPYQETDVGIDLGNQTKSPIGPKEYLIESLIRSLEIDEPMRKVLDTKSVDEQLELLGLINQAKQTSNIGEGGLGMLSDVMNNTSKFLDDSTKQQQEIYNLLSNRF